MPKEIVTPKSATHTPGPWRFERDGDDRICTDRVCVALVTRAVDEECDANMMGPTYEANARLIAAAPDLLTIAKAAYHALESYAHGNSSPDLAKQVAAALDITIAKAEGRS